MEFIKNIFIKLSEVDYHSILFNIPIVNPFSNIISNMKKKISYHVKSFLFDYFIWGVRKYYNIYFSFCKVVVNIKKIDFIQYIYNYFKETPQIPKFKLCEVSLYYSDNEYHFVNLHKEMIYHDLTKVKKQQLLTNNYIQSHNNKNRNKEIIDTYISINDHYIHVCQKSKVTSNYIEKNSETKFIYIIYINNETNETVELSLDKEMYNVGNQLFSPAFVYKLLMDQKQESKYNMDYIIELIDNHVNIIKIKQNKIIELTEEGYTIKDIE